LKVEYFDFESSLVADFVPRHALRDSFM